MRTTVPENVGRALFGLVAFFFGVFVLPAVHQVGHRPDHVHGKFGIVWLDGGVHEHSHPHSHARPHPHGTDARGAREHGDHGAPVQHHGDGALEHFGVAILVPAPFVLSPTSERTEPLVPLAIASVHLARPELGPRQSRAPPC